MESNENGEHKRRAILYRGIIQSPEVISDSSSPFFNYGEGFFETVLYENNKLQYLDEHLIRMKKTCSDFNIKLNYEEIDRLLIEKLLRDNGLESHTCRVKILYAPVKDSSRWDTVVTAAPYTRPVKDFSLSIHNEVYDSKLNRYKSMNYQYNLYWKKNYHIKEYSDEVLFCNKEGNILEGSYTNILFVKDAVLYYVDRRNNYLQGIMQDQVLKTASETGNTVEALVDGIPLNQLKDADEVMICNSLMTVQNVRKIIVGDKVYRWKSSPSGDYVCSRLRDSLTD